CRPAGSTIPSFLSHNFRAVEYNAKRPQATLARNGKSTGSHGSGTPPVMNNKADARKSQSPSTTRHRLCGHFTTRLRRHVTQGWTTTPRKVSDVRHYGVDVSAVGAGMAGTTANFELRQTDGIHMPFDSDSIDLVVSNQLMEHLH